MNGGTPNTNSTNKHGFFFNESTPRAIHSNKETILSGRKLKKNSKYVH